MGRVGAREDGKRCAARECRGVGAAHLRVVVKVVRRHVARGEVALEEAASGRAGDARARGRERPRPDRHRRLAALGPVGRAQRHAQPARAALRVVERGRPERTGAKARGVGGGEDAAAGGGVDGHDAVARRLRRAQPLHVPWRRRRQVDADGRQRRRVAARVERRDGARDGAARGHLELVELAIEREVAHAPGRHARARRRIVRGAVRHRHVVLARLARRKVDVPVDRAAVEWAGVAEAAGGEGDKVARLRAGRRLAILVPRRHRAVRALLARDGGAVALDGGHVGPHARVVVVVGGHAAGGRPRAQQQPVQQQRRQQAPAGSRREQPLR